jgi:hypothetical protein
MNIDGAVAGMEYEVPMIIPATQGPAYSLVY